ncbi:MAG TPA: hypothetical protein PLS90_09310 [Candidatus Sumerlaeota bacterium]|nr:hypothetical protein [Candidatus Sumerlaeota bacterium]HPK02642.1 hypothetical protein [Candidatus Sumerlaeota bacterium]
MLVATICWTRGLRFADPPEGMWDFFWQAIPKADLIARPWQSIWRLHAQPPGYQLWGLFWLALGGPERFPANVQIGHVLLGGLVTAFSWKLAHALTGSRAWATLAGLLTALNPSLFLYEGYLIYEMLVIALVTGAGVALWRTLREGRTRWLVLYCALLNLLVLTRSLYHLVFLAAALAPAWPALRRLRPWGRVLLLAGTFALPVAWYGKNYCQYGFFGASSWFGMGLFKTVSTYYLQPDWEAVEPAIRPDYPYVLDKYAYQHAIAEYEAYGFDRESEVPLLSRNNLHNINVPEISAGYGAAALKLIRLRPALYLLAVLDGYGSFCRTPGTFVHLSVNWEQVPWLPVYREAIYGEWLESEFSVHLPFSIGSMMFFYFPALMLGGCATVGYWRRRARARGLFDPRPWLLGWMVLVCVYVAIIGSLFENGENMRFRFATEPLTFAIGLLLIRGGWRRWLRPWPGRLRQSRGAARRRPGR